MSHLVIVESPSKSKTISKYLSDDFVVKSSKGHIRDLAISGKGGLGVDIENEFAPHYVISKDKKDVVKELKACAKKADDVYLATDPDREGEAISWHLAEVLGLDPETTKRVEFHEVTKNAVTNAIENPRRIDMDLVHSQETRRVLDRIIGFKLSKLLQKKIKSKSAGRVQSVALRLICEREAEIDAFVPEEFWKIDAEFEKDNIPFKAELTKHKTKKLEIHNGEEAQAIYDALGSTFTVEKIKKTTKKRNSYAPFITSTLQQEASSKLGFKARRTMSIAQKLYEGIDIGTETVGLITYMRTDSLRLSDDALNGARDYIQQRWGDKYLPSEPRKYKSRSNAQDGHEAIRPTMIELSPDKVKDSLTPEQYKLYKIIWERFIACQMSDCIHKTTSAEILAGNYIFKASGYRVDFDGFTVLYVESKDTDEESEQELPPLKEGMELRAKTISPNQHFTQPPARYTEASLVKELETKGIGRPSTYSPIITTIIERRYIEKDKKQLVPTQLGEVVNTLLTENFTDIIDVTFTARVEDEFDEVAEGKEEWKQILREFYPPFEKELEKVDKELEHVKLEDEVSDVKCDKCGRMMVIKMSRYGKFLACPGYPECKNVKPFVVTIDVPCPVCGGQVQVRKTKRGKNYYICENNKNTEESCKFISWDKPKVGEPWNPEEEKQKAPKRATRRKKTTTKKTAKKSTTKKKK